jgi:glutamyl-tRNA reductase
MGTNHRTAPLNIREKMAVSAEKMPAFLEKLRRHIPCGVIISTCNRTEIYTAGNDSDSIARDCLDFLKSHLRISDRELGKHIYSCKDREAVDHLFRVASGLESMIVGEYEVLSQVSQALAMAEKAGMVNHPLRYLFRSAVKTGRLVRQKTDISKNAMSVSSVAVDLATKVHGDIENCKIVIIGAGEAGRLVIKIARERGASRIVVASRTLQRARVLAEKLNGIPVDHSRVIDEIGDAHIVVTCTGAPHWVLDTARVIKVMDNRNAPMVLIDIAVPRNVEPEVKRVDGVSLYNIDDLTRMVDSNRKQREGEMEKAAAVIDGELDKFMARWEEQSIRPVVKALMSKAEAVRSSQLKKTMKKMRDLSEEEKESLDAMTRAIVNRILQDPIRYLKSNSNGNTDSVEKLNRIFNLPDEEEE